MQEKPTREAYTRYYDYSDIALHENLDHALLTHDEEVELSIRVKNGDEKARAILVEKNQRLVFRLALKFFEGGMKKHQDLSDLVQWGNLGLLEAIEKFEPERGHRFSTYAVWWIRCYIRRFGLVNSSHLSMSCGFSEKMNKVRRQYGIFVQQNSRTPTPEELVELSGLSLEDVLNSLHVITSPLRIDQDKKNEQSYTDPPLAESIPDREQDFENDVLENVFTEEVIEHIKILPPRYQYVILHHFGINGNKEMTQAQISKKLNVSHTRILQIEQRALHLLKEAMQTQ